MKTIYTLSITAIMLISIVLPLWGNIPAQERAALIALYNSTNGDSWTDNSGWKDGTLEVDGFAAYGTENTWFGVTCDVGNTTVSVVSISANSLTGIISPELDNLPNLTSIELGGNQITGNIPAQLGNLLNLQRLNLYSNQLTGSIPPGLGNLSNLRFLSLYNNQLTGTIPPELSSLANLQYLELYSNQLTGTIPTTLGNLTNLRTLDLRSNQLTGTIPTTLGNLTNLQYLYLYINQLTGTIPAELGNLTNLRRLFLYDNQLTGSIPTTLGNLSNLQYLYLHENQLTGSIPAQLGNLTNLTALSLDINQLTGNIPPELGNLSILQSLGLKNNQLAGTIPPELGNMASLQNLWLSSNQLTGSIPAQLENLSNLKQIWLDNNRLTGSIPAELGNLSGLLIFYLQSNRLSGSIPITLTNLTNLNTNSMNIGYNSLYTDDAGLISFLNSEDSDWETTQTIAPTNPSASAQSATSILLTWTPITYTSDSGGYQVFYSTIPGGPYTLFDTTTDKTISQMEVTGLAPGTQYYFVIQTHTDAHAGNQNALDSEFSQEVSATTSGTITVRSPQKNDVYNARTVIHIQWDAPGFTGEVEVRLYQSDETNHYLISDDHPVGAPLDYIVTEGVAKGVYFIEVRQGSIIGRSGLFYIDDQSRITNRKPLDYRFHLN